MKHVIFDLDGTLADTAKATTIACNQISQEMGFPRVTNEQVKKWMGYPSPTFYESLFPGQEKEWLRHYAEKTEWLEQQMIRELQEQILFPGIQELLGQLKGAGFQLYIASTGSKEHVFTLLEGAKINAFFSSVSCNEAYKVEMVSRILRGRDPAQWVMVGDKKKDADGAKGNGIYVIGAGFGYCSEPDWPLFDRIVKSPEALFQVLLRWQHF